MKQLGYLSRISACSSHPSSWDFEKSGLVLCKAGVESTNEAYHRRLDHDLSVFWVVTNATTIYDFHFIGYPYIFVISRRPTSFSFSLQAGPGCSTKWLHISVYICCGPLQLAYLLAPSEDPAPLSRYSKSKMASTEVISKQYVPLTCHGHSRPVTHLSFSGLVGNVDEEYYLISACKGECLP